MRVRSGPIRPPMAPIAWQLRHAVRPRPWWIPQSALNLVRAATPGRHGALPDRPGTLGDDFAYNIAGEAFVFDSDMEWDVNSPWYREVTTIHMVPGGDAGYRNGTGKFQDEYFDIIPRLRHLRRGSPVGVETYQSYAYPRRSSSTTSSRRTGRAGGCCTRR